MVAPLSVMPRWSGMRSTTGCDGLGSNSVELAPGSPHTWRANSIDGELHAEADAEERNAALARVAHRGDLALGAARAETGRHQDGVGLGQDLVCPLLLDVLGVDVLDVDAGVVGMPPWISASLRLLYDSTSCTYLPTKATVTSARRIA